MHFWINKPAGRNYGFGGRRYPCASSSSKGRSGERGRRGREIGPMVTPVHRFQSLNGPSGPVHCYTPGPSFPPRSQHQQQLRHHHQQSEPTAAATTTSTTHRPQPYPQQQRSCPVPDDETDEETTTADRGIAPPRTSRSNILISNNVTNAAAAAASAGVGNSTSERPVVAPVNGETTNNGLNRAVFLDFSEISDTELAGYRLRCGVWITFVLATGFVSVAKFYFSNRDTGLDMLIFCGLLFTLLLSGCFYSTFRRAHNNHHHHRHHRDDDEQLEPEEQHIATLAATLSTSRVDNPQHGMHLCSLALQQPRLILQRQSPSPPPPPPPPPPPYHIAILIPPLDSPEEAPPPSYDKAVNEDPANRASVFIFSKDQAN